MIDCCVKQEYPCLRQSVSRSLLSDNVLDGVLVAYGSHHIEPDDRLSAVTEAYRTLAPNRRLVFHDFEVGSPMDTWFADVVDPFSLTGHLHQHFSYESLSDNFSTAGFRHIDISRIEDPFEATGVDEIDAKRNILTFLHSMYGLEKYPLSSESNFLEFEKIVSDVFGGIEIYTQDGRYHSIINRQAIVAVGTK